VLENHLSGLSTGVWMKPVNQVPLLDQWLIVGESYVFIISLQDDALKESQAEQVGLLYLAKPFTAAWEKLGDSNCDLSLVGSLPSLPRMTIIFFVFLPVH
jgi:hypothetical protein